MNHVLELSQIDKSFTGVHALKAVDFELRRGEIHALVGENGAGKSTLMKVITGIEQRDSGKIQYLGLPFNPKGPGHSQRLGIGIIHQELNMMDHLTVAQNVFIGREAVKAGGLFLSDREQLRRTSELFQRLSINVDPGETLGHLTVGKQQMVEIAKTISHPLRVLILDEPSAALTNREIEELFRIMRDLASQGVSMIHISHRLDEIHQIADRVTVMRDGRRVGTENASDVSRQDIINMMVGRTVFEQPKQHSTVGDDAPVVLKAVNLNAGNQVKDVSFELRKGEILGFSGLIGSGRTETARAIFGADKIDSGHIEVNGKPVRIGSPSDAVAHGIGYLSEDRKRFGLALGMTVADNAVLASFQNYQRGLLLDRKKILQTTQEFVTRLSIRTPTVEQIVRNLSDGNQQKVIIAKWLIHNSDILIFDEPTRGIDVGAKGEIYALMNELVAQGKSIIMISSELPEILRMSDRVAVMCEGRITGVLDISEASQQEIMKYATMREIGVGQNVQ